MCVYVFVFLKFALTLHAKTGCIARPHVGGRTPDRPRYIFLRTQMAFQIPSSSNDLPENFLLFAKGLISR